MDAVDSYSVTSPADSLAAAQRPRRPRRRKPASPAWRLLDTAGGVAIGLLLALLAQSWASGRLARALGLPVSR